MSLGVIPRRWVIHLAQETITMEFNFADHTSVEDINKVPQDFRGLYSKGDDGKYALASDHEGVKSAVSAITKLSGALAAERKNRPAKVDLTPLAAYGDSPDTIATTIAEKMAELETAAAGSKDAKLNIDKVRQELAAGHAKETEKYVKREEALKNQLYGMMVETAATTAIAELKGVPELLLPFIKNQVKVVEEEGEFKVFVVDGGGDRRYSGATGQPMSIKELVAEMKATEKYGRLFESDAREGGGTKPGAANPGARKMAVGAGKDGELTAMQKISQGLQKGQARSGK